MKYNTKKSVLRQHWMKLIESKGPYRYMVTVTFKYNLSDNEIIKSTDTLLHFLNRKLFGTHYRDIKKHLKGFVIAERQARRVGNMQSNINNIINNTVKTHDRFRTNCTKLKRKIVERNRKALHFHILIKEDEIFEEVNFRDLLNIMIRKIKKKTKNRKEIRVMNKNGIDVRDVYDIEGITDYLTKTLRGGYPTIGDFIEVLDQNGTNHVSRKGWCT